MRNAGPRWFLLLLLAGCVTAPPYHSCLDPCEGRCVRGERCEPGPPPSCAILPLSEMEVTDTASPSGPLQ